MSQSPLSVLFLGKASDELCGRAASYLTLHGVRTTVCLGARGEPFPTLPADEGYDVMISYLSPWIIPSAVLQRAQRAAVNFHPGPPEYPGIGCTNFAIYEGATTYGVTCHHMHPKVDTGPIIRVVRFPLYPTDTVLSLTQRCYAAIANVFYEIADLLLAGQPLPASPERWCRRPFRRSELDGLCRLTPDMSEEEIQRRVRATVFPGYPGASCSAPDIVERAPSSAGAPS